MTSNNDNAAIFPSLGYAPVDRPVLRYHGGKWLLAKWIISHFPKHRIYCELFGGGGSVLMRKEPAYCEVYNDLWDVVVNVFNVLRDPDLAKELQRVLYLTPFSRTEFESVGDVEIAKITDPVERARRTIFRSFAGFGSAATNAKYATGFRANSHRSGTTPAMDWANFPKHIDSFVERLRGVVIENRDYRKIITQHDSENTLFYVDPPYVHATRNMARGNAAYAHEMTDDDHVELATHLRAIRGMVVLSGYHSDLYDKLFHDWHFVERETHADGAVDRKEVLWLSPKTLAQLEKQKIKVPDLFNGA